MKIPFMKIPMPKVVLMLLAAVLLSATADSALAAGSGLPTAANPLLRPALFGFWEEKKPIVAIPKEYPVHDNASFQQLTKAYGMTPFGKAELEYEITLPKDWKEEDIPQSLTDAQTIIGDVARYTSPMIGTQKIEVVIQVMRLEHEISAQNWLKNYVLISGFTQQGDMRVDGVKTASIDYISAGLAGATSTFETISAHITGSYIVLATFRTPLPLQGYVKYLQKKSIESFRILYPKEDPVEEQKIFTLVDSIKFSFPASWNVVASDFRDMNHLSVHLQAQSVSNSVDGFVRILALRRSRSTTLKAELDEQKKYFEGTMKVKFLKMLSTGKSPAYSRFLFNRYEAYDVQDIKGAGIVQEIHVVVLGDKDWYIFAYLFTPKESTNLYTWARNTQSFQEILKSIK